MPEFEDWIGRRAERPMSRPRACWPNSAPRSHPICSNPAIPIWRRRGFTGVSRLPCRPPPNWARMAVRPMPGWFRPFPSRAACGLAEASRPSHRSGAAPQSTACPLSKLSPGVTALPGRSTSSRSAMSSWPKVLWPCVSGRIWSSGMRHRSRAQGARSADAQDDLAWTVDAGPVLLFRFSALTFNSHRIHYDERYARSEGYPGLLVQGPLQAALMLNQISVLKGERPTPLRLSLPCTAVQQSGPPRGLAWRRGPRHPRRWHHNGGRPRSRSRYMRSSTVLASTMPPSRASRRASSSGNSSTSMSSPSCAWPPPSPCRSAGE